MAPRAVGCCVLIGAVAANMIPGPPPTISNPNVLAAKPFSTEYTAEYFDLYSKPLRTRYSEVYWASQGELPLPEELVERFQNKTMAIVGYEADQVYQTAEGEVPVPITAAYNHHYEVYFMSSQARLVRRHAQGDHSPRGHDSAGEYWDVVAPNSAPGIDGEIHSQFFSEGNGGEMRRSFHGYAKGYGQLIWSPSKWSIIPMQIDTLNREQKGKGFVPGPLPRSALAPPNASYSGLVECPCSTRLKRESRMAYAALREGACPERPANASECFEAACEVKPGAAFSNRTVSDAGVPPGCSITVGDDGVQEAVWNEAQSATSCGKGGEARQVVAVASSVVKVTVDLRGGGATITLSGPASAWFGVGFGADSMCLHMDGDECPEGGPYAVIVSGDVVVERKLELHGPGSKLEPSIAVASNTAEGGVRTVVLTRALKGKSARHFSFDMSRASEKFVAAVGHGLTFDRHAQHGSGNLAFMAVGERSCVCRDGLRHFINGNPFPYPSNCWAPPLSDVLAQRNPSCFGDTYGGGKKCCIHGHFLLDADQEVPESTQEYRLKFRFYFEEYSPGPKPSHVNLIRLYHMTEMRNGEYDIVPCLPGTPPESCVQVLTARWKVRDMMRACPSGQRVDCTGSDSTDASKVAGLHLLYAGPHCHAPDCLSMELYNADTGRLLCRMEPEFGASDEVYDERGYVALPPCLWGDISEGLQQPELLPLDTTLLSIKRNNNTVGHYGEMASWQMRAAVIPRAEAGFGCVLGGGG